MSGCSYCGRPGCGYDTCPERLEDKYGVASDYSEEFERKEDDDTEPASEVFTGP